MTSLTPKSRSAEVTGAAMSEGIINGGMVFVPSMAALHIALRNPRFRQLTNWQSRTAMVLMPTLFAFALTSEQKLNQRMHQVAEETEHAVRTVEWAERHKQQQSQNQVIIEGSVFDLHPDKTSISSTTTDTDTSSSSVTTENNEKKEDLMQLYRKSVLEGGRVRLVETETLAWYQSAANFVQSNPVKVLAGIGVPAVAVIFYGQNQGLQMRILHTRVYGQFTVLCTLLSIMGVKEYMDRHGTFITEAHVEERVQNMADTRRTMLERFERENALYQKSLRRRDQKS